MSDTTGRWRDREVTINNWKPEVKSLLRRLEKSGFLLDSGHNGEDEFKFDGDRAAFVENLIACDEANIYVRHKDTPGKLFAVYLVLGNDPGELVSDYSWSECPAGKELDAACFAHSEEWTGREQPKTTVVRRCYVGELRGTDAI